MSKETKIVGGEPINKFDVSKYSNEMIELQMQSASKKAAKGNKAASAFYVALKSEADRRARMKAKSTAAKPKGPVIVWPKTPVFKK